MDPPSIDASDGKEHNIPARHPIPGLRQHRSTPSRCSSNGIGFFLATDTIVQSSRTDVLWFVPSAF
jgi:hypothetical protein